MADLKHILVLCCVLSLFVGGLTLTVDDCPKFNETSQVIIRQCDDACYYFYVNEAKTFTAASAVCGGRGGALAMPKSRETSNFLKDILGTRGKTWLGLLQEKLTKSTAYFWLNGQDVERHLVPEILEYGDAYTISRSYRGVWDFNHIDKDKKNRFVCELPQESIVNPTSVATRAPPSTTPQGPIIPIVPKIPIEKYFCQSVMDNTNDEPNVKFFGESCFYFALNNRFTYDSADAFCKKHQGTLAIVKSNVIDLFLQYTLLQELKERHYNVWIGLKTNDDSRNPYSWDDGSPVTYKNFRYAFPAWDHYAMVWKVQKWEAYPKGLRKNFICQFPAEVLPVN